jgi:hypothetical protein
MGVAAEANSFVAAVAVFDSTYVQDSILYRQTSDRAVTDTTLNTLFRGDFRFEPSNGANTVS